MLLENLKLPKYLTLVTSITFPLESTDLDLSAFWYDLGAISHQIGESPNGRSFSKSLQLKNSLEVEGKNVENKERTVVSMLKIVKGSLFLKG